MRCHSFLQNYSLLCAATTVFGLAVGFGATSAEAISILIESVTATNDLENLIAGDEITLGIVYSNPDSDPVAGLGVEAFGWDTSVLSIARVEVADSAFSQAFASTPSGIVGLGGLPNIATGSADPPPAESDSYQIFNGITITPTIATGTNDVGVSGSLISEGDVHALVTFMVLCGGSTTVQVGGIADRGDAEVLVFPGSPTQVVTRDTNVASLDIVTGGPPLAVPDPPIVPPDTNVPDTTPPDDLPDPDLPDIDPPSTELPQAGAPEEPVTVIDLTLLRAGPPGPDGTIMYFTSDGILVTTTSGGFDAPPIPEPTTAMLSLIGLALMAATSRRREL
jgi:hypothetical protein